MYPGLCLDVPGGDTADDDADLGHLAFGGAGITGVGDSWREGKRSDHHQC